MRIRAVVTAGVLALIVTTTACSGGVGGGGGVFRQYEYEEDVYLSLDGTATMYVNASIPALDALRGTSFDTTPNRPVDRAAVRALFSTPVTHVNGQVNVSRRSNRRFVHVKIDVDDIRRLGEAAPFAWSTYSLALDDDRYVYRQAVGAAAGKDVGDVGWNGQESVAFRLHPPSKIDFHNTGREVRGNILIWEQLLTDRLRGIPLAIEARLETQSILYRTLWLFGWTFVAVAITFVLVIWWVLRRVPAAAEKRIA